MDASPCLRGLTPRKSRTGPRFPSPSLKSEKQGKHLGNRFHGSQSSGTALAYYQASYGIL